MTDQGEQAKSGFSVENSEALARNMAQLYEEYGHAVSAYLAPRESGEVSSGISHEANDAIKTLGRVAETWLADPQRAVEMQTQLWNGVIELWASSMRRMSGEPTPNTIEPAAKDNRFKDPDWNRNLFFDFCKQLYLLTSQWASNAVKEADGLDDHTRHKAEFYVKQISDALSPSNFIMTNPEVLRETLANNGENLVRGMKMFAEDIRAGNGELRIRQSDTSRYEVGKNLAITSGKVIFQNDLLQLIQYTPATERVSKRPLLIIPPWINKYYIMDLTPEKSLMKWLIDQEQTVFVISWVNPDERQAEKSFDAYMQEGILAAVSAIEACTGEREINALGYCVGGTLLCVTLAYMAAIGDKRIATATLITTQVDFTHAGDLKVFVDEEQLEHMEDKMNVRGFLEGKRMAAAFSMLRANDLIWPYYVNNYLKGKQPEPFDLLYWNADSTRMPAANHAFYLRNCYLDNKIAKGELVVSGQKIDLKAITIPIYALAAREDHIAPAKSVFFGAHLFGGTVDYILAGSGHIAGPINHPSKNKYQYWTGGKPIGTYEEWLTHTQEHAGSWWPHWQSWLRAHNNEIVAARIPGAGALPALEDAPGSYVKVRD